MVKQVNLLPDSKQVRLRAQRARKLSIVISSIIMAVAIGVPVLLLAIKGSQALLLNRTQDRIDQHKATLQSTPNITTMLTVKDHLSSLPSLYEQRLVVSELMAFLPSVLPAEIRLSNIEIDTSGGLTLSGVSPSYAGVDRLYRALLVAGDLQDPNRVEDDPQIRGYFTSVVLENASGPSGSEVNFTIKASFDARLIDGEPNG